MKAGTTSDAVGEGHQLGPHLDREFLRDVKTCVQSQLTTPSKAIVEVRGVVNDVDFGNRFTVQDRETSAKWSVQRRLYDFGMLMSLLDIRFCHVVKSKSFNFRSQPPSTPSL